MKILVIGCSCLWLNVFILIVQGQNLPCSRKPKFANGNAVPRKDRIILRYKCSEKFKRVGRRFALCIDGEWSVPPPTCIRQGCNSLTQTPGLIMKKAHKGAMLKFHCSDGKTRHGPEFIYCNGSKWNTDPPKCVDGERRECDFEDKNLCGWSQSIFDDFEWKWHSGRTPSSQTGPKADHRKRIDGHYIYIEASLPRKVGDTAVLMSPTYVPQEDVCFIFWYHMFGSGIGSLEVYIKRKNQRLIDLQPHFKLKGNQGRKWRKFNMTIGNQNKAFQIVLVGTTGKTIHGDIAVDDVSLYKCSDLKEDLNSKTTKISTKEKMMKISTAGYEKAVHQSTEPPTGTTIIQSPTPWNKTSMRESALKTSVSPKRHSNTSTSTNILKEPLATTFHKEPIHSTFSNQLLPTITSPKQPMPRITTSIQQLPTRITSNQPLSRRTTSNQALSTKTNLNQQVPKRTTSNQPVHTTRVTSNQPVPTRTTSSQPVPTRTTSNQPVHTRTTSSQPVPTRTTSSQPVPTRTTSNQPRQTTTSKASSNQPRQSSPIEAKHPMPTITTSIQPLPTRIASNQPLSRRTTSNQKVPTKTNSNQPVPTRTTSNQTVHTTRVTSNQPVQPTRITSSQTVPTRTTSSQSVPIRTASKQSRQTTTSMTSSNQPRQPSPIETAPNQPRQPLPVPSITEQTFVKEMHEIHQSNQTVKKDKDNTEMYDVEDHVEVSGSGEDTTNSGMNLEDHESNVKNNSVKANHYSTSDAQFFETGSRLITEQSYTTTLSSYSMGETRHTVNTVHDENDRSSYRITAPSVISQTKTSTNQITSSDYTSVAPLDRDSPPISSSHPPATSVSTKASLINEPGDFFFTKVISSFFDDSSEQTSTIKFMITPKEDLPMEEVGAGNSFLPKEDEMNTTVIDISGSLDTESHNSSQNNDGNESISFNESKVTDASIFSNLPIVMAISFLVGLLAALIAVAVYFWAKKEKREMDRIKRRNLA